MCKRSSMSRNLGRDFLGRSYSMKASINKLNTKIAQISYGEEIQKQLLNLTNAYIQVGLSRAQLRFQMEASKRATARLKLVKLRVETGVGHKVELYQAQASLYHQRERVNSSNLRLQSKLQDISALLQRVVKIQEIDDLPYPQGPTPMPKIPRDLLVNNKQLQILEGQKSIEERRLQLKRMAKWPDISLILGHKTNGVAYSGSQAIEEGHLAKSDHSQRTISLNVSWPWGSAPQRLEENQGQIKLESAKMLHSRMQLNLQSIITTLQKKIRIVDNNVKSVQKRLDLAKKTLRGQNTLFKQGRIGLDQVIRAEETLIDTHTGHANYLAQREQLVHDLSYSLGILKEFIFKVSICIDLLHTA